MNFEYTPEQEMLVKTATEVAEEFGPDYWYEHEENEEYAEEFWDALADAGFQGALVPEEYGGAGMGMQEMALSMETLVSEGAGLAGVWYLVLSGTMAAAMLKKNANERQKEELLPGIASGDLAISWGITEPNAGTNTLNLDMTADRDGDEFVVNGEKTFITWADHADRIILVTRTSEPDTASNRSHGITLMYAELPDENVQADPIPLHGIGYSNSCQLYVDDLRVPAENVIGEVDRGWYALLDALNPERLSFAAAATGLGKLALSHASDYANEREVFGQPIGAHQGVQHPLAKSYAAVESASQMRLKACWAFDEDREDAGLQANAAKAAAVEAGIDAVYNSMQAFGGAGYARENHVERWWREVNLIRLAPVTQQMAHNHIAQEALDLPRSY